MNRLALFDCDGTLVDSAANICHVAEIAFDRHGLVPPTRPAIRRIVGLSLVEAMAALHPHGTAALHIAMAETYRHEFHRLRDTPDFAHEPLYDGIAAAITAIADAGWMLGVATGKSDRGLAIVLATHGLADRFVTLQTADRHPSKPHPAMALAAMAEANAAPDTTVVIGDTGYDMAMARSAGAQAIGVGWGYHPPADLIAAGAHHVVHHPDALPATIFASIDAAAMAAS